MPNPEFRSTLAADWLLWRDLAAIGPCTANHLAENSSRSRHHVTTRLGILAQRGHVAIAAVRGKSHQRVYIAVTEPLPYPKHGGRSTTVRREPECLLANLWPIRLRYRWAHYSTIWSSILRFARKGQEPSGSCPCLLDQMVQYSEASPWPIRLRYR